MLGKAQSVLAKAQSVLAKSKDALIFMAMVVAAMVVAAVVEDTDAADFLGVPAMAALIALVLLELAFLWHSLQCARKEEERYGSR